MLGMGIRVNEGAIKMYLNKFNTAERVSSCISSDWGEPNIFSMKTSFVGSGGLGKRRVAMVILIRIPKTDPVSATVTE